MAFSQSAPIENAPFTFSGRWALIAIYRCFLLLPQQASHPTRARHISGFRNATGAQAMKHRSIILAVSLLSVMAAGCSGRHDAAGTSDSAPAARKSLNDVFVNVARYVCVKCAFGPAPSTSRISICWSPPRRALTLAWEPALIQSVMVALARSAIPLGVS